ncbi:MAG: DUF3089 domain-containing protein [Actinobacteria bacterium]|uniref:Unannotated protein n=1 Tax=freshwater metagenome TaxID=449393 RepID=A0A6J6PKZ6_9ZZZZ|nr:DUF3089 domain-containing protein [Actinomycetota bacterium]
MCAGGRAKRFWHRVVIRTRTHFRRHTRAITLATFTAAVALATSGCGGSKHAATTSPAPSNPNRDAWGTVWLCRPGLADNPCAGALTTTAVAPNGTRTVIPARANTKAAIDCFYLYPTISRQQTLNANLTIGLEERLIATAQAAPFSQTCRVFAPMYRQVTNAGLKRKGEVRARAERIAYRSALDGFKNYLAHYNNGRGIVLIGHSQGASALVGIIRATVDKDPALRKQLVSALILGGNVTVARGKTTGGDFTNVPLCTAAPQTGCVIAYSTYSSAPPANALFSRPGSALDPFTRNTDVSNLQTACVNPAAPGGGTTPLTAAFPSLTLGYLAAQTHVKFAVATPWASFPGEFTATCRTNGSASWLQVAATTPRGRSLLTLANGLGPQWGLHLLDVNVALGDLVTLVRAEARTYAN